MFIGKHQHGQADLLQVVQANRRFPLLLSLGQGRQQQAGKDGDDRNDHQEFNQREG